MSLGLGSGLVDISCCGERKSGLTWRMCGLHVTMTRGAALQWGFLSSSVRGSVQARDGTRRGCVSAPIDDESRRGQSTVSMQSLPEIVF